MFEMGKVAKRSGDIAIVSGGNERDRSVAIQGQVTVSNSGEIRAALTNALRTKPTSVCVDLSSVAYLDTSGLATLIEAARIAHNQGTRLLLSGLRDQPRYLFEITHLDRFFETAEAGATP